MNKATFLLTLNLNLVIFIKVYVDAIQDCNDLAFQFGNTANGVGAAWRGAFWSDPANSSWRQAGSTCRRLADLWDSLFSLGGDLGVALGERPLGPWLRSLQVGTKRL